MVADIDGAFPASAGDGGEGGGLIAIALPAGSKIYLSLQPVDMRKGFDGLAAQVQPILARDPFSVICFCSMAAAATG